MTKYVALHELLWVGLVLLTNGAITIWSAYLYGRHITPPETVVIGGLGLNGVAIVLFVLTLNVGMCVGPTAMRKCWSLGERLAPCLLGVVWITACALSAAVVLRTNPLGLPGWPPFGGEMDTWMIPVGTIVFILLLITSLVPAALSRADDVRSWGMADPVSKPTQATATTPSTERLWSLLNNLFQSGPGPVDTKTTVLTDGTIATSQGALADRLDTSKGSIHRGLIELKRLGRIILETNPRQTLIRRAPPGGTVVSLFPVGSPRPGTLKTGLNGTERGDPNRP